MSRELCDEVLDAGVREVTRAVVQEALAQAKQHKKEKLETLRLTFQRRQLHKLWNRF